ncbi:MAG: Aerobic carbon monoxide dehydrogenase (quinone), medium chain [Ktedonobacterales bacterium]|jgi:carbon-monoxide dehydrogenase medium subunit|nr:MAG: Aerobic carbon monoxide dehydrogenase (quinone), medium chain [Ktedonobacterales bacterium]
MFAKDFSYAAPASLAEALALLQSQPEGEVKLVAGGQSLIPLLKLRMTEIGALVDVSKIPELHGITDDGDGVVIGAATTYFQAVNSPLVQKRCPLVIQAVSQVGDPQVRARGTIGGSLAHADPAGDLPAVALAVDAELRATGPSGSRSIPATAFFVDLMTTALQPAEVLTAVRFHATDAPHAGTAYVKHRHPASGYAIVGVAAAVWLNDDGTCRAAHVGITGAGTHATRAAGVEQALTGKRLDDATLTAACANAADGLDLMSDPYASGEYRAHLTRVLAKRALAQAAATAAQR